MSDLRPEPIRWPTARVIAVLTGKGETPFVVLDGHHDGITHTQTALPDGTSRFELTGTPSNDSGQTASILRWVAHGLLDQADRLERTHP